MVFERVRIFFGKILRPGAVWAVISGAITAAAAMYSHTAWLAWISLIPYFMTLYQYTEPEGGKRHLFGIGFLFGCGYYLPLFSFFYTLYPMDFAGLSPQSSVFFILLAQFGLSALYSLAHGFLPCILRLQRKRGAWGRWPLLLPLSIAALWVLIEWSQAQTWMGVPWGRLAVSQYRLTPLIQSASLLGSYFISFLLVLFNALLAHYLYQRFVLKDAAVKRCREILCLVCAATLFSGNLLYGVITLNIEQKPVETISAAIVQGNISSSKKWEENGVDIAAELYLRMTRELSEDGETDLIVWNETCIPVALNKYPALMRQIQETAMECNAVILVGSFYEDETDEYNGIYAFYPDGTVGSQPYFKRRLVPFGEYMPLPAFLQSVIPVLDEINLLESSLTPGTDSNVFSTDFGMIGGLICFDSIYETLALSSVRDGAGLLALLTNDSWYDNSPAVYEHLGHAALRAVENGRYMVRGANTGISAVIDSNGRIKIESHPQTEEVIRGEVDIYSHRTLYSYVGNILVLLCLIYVVVLFIPFRKKSKFKR